MATFTFNCPQCGNLLSGEEEWRGMETQCPYCQKTIIIPLPLSSIQVKIPPQYFGGKRKLFIAGIIVFLLIASTVTYFTLKSKSTFLLEEIAGVNIGQSVSNKNPDGNTIFNDYFHCFDISEQYKGKIIFEKVSFPTTLSDIYIGDGTAVVSTPAAIADANNNVRWLAVIITDKKLFANVIQDFANKGFGSGKKGYSPAISTHISELLHCDFSKNETYSFSAKDNQYKLYVFTGERPGLLNHKEKIYGAYVVLSEKIPKDSRKGIRLLMDSSGFLNTSMISSVQKTSILVHSTIHYQHKSSSCVHTNGFSK